MNKEPRITQGVGGRLIGIYIKVNRMIC